jgi:hypothetical protein
MNGRCSHAKVCVAHIAASELCTLLIQPQWTCDPSNSDVDCLTGACITGNCAAVSRFDAAACPCFVRVINSSELIVL